MPVTAKRLLDVLRTAAVDLDESGYSDTVAACREIIETLVEEGADTVYFPDAVVRIATSLQQ